MQLSVIVPVYNMAGEGKLNFCMDSLLNQTIVDYEIIAVDDASTDGSLEILRAYEGAGHHLSGEPPPGRREERGAAGRFRRMGGLYR